MTMTIVVWNTQMEWTSNVATHSIYTATPYHIYLNHPTFPVTPMGMHENNHSSSNPKLKLNTIWVFRRF